MHHFTHNVLQVSAVLISLHFYIYKLRIIPFLRAEMCWSELYFVWMISTGIDCNKANAPFMYVIWDEIIKFYDFVSRNYDGVAESRNTLGDGEQPLEAFHVKIWVDTHTICFDIIFHCGLKLHSNYIQTVRVHLMKSWNWIPVD